MNKKLSILIPIYKEADYLIKRLLDSIAIQQHIDFDTIEVLVGQDGDETKYNENLFNGYNFDLNHFIFKKRGVSATRNELLDKAKGEYIQWCDADDMFVSVFALYPVFREIKVGFDALVGNFYSEIPFPDSPNDYLIQEMQMNGMQFVHNKVYRRRFLIDNEIRFCEKSNIHEDHPIFAMAKAYSQNIRYQPIPTYGWMHNEISVCRRDPLYLQKTTKNLLMNNAYLLEKFIKRGRIDIVRETAFSMVMDIYYSLNAKQWLETANKEFRDECEGYFKHYYNHYKQYIKELAEDKKQQIIAGQKMIHTQQGVLLENITFNDWLNYIETKVEPIDFHIETIMDKA